MEPINKKTIERLCIYRRILRKLINTGVEHFYSHDLAGIAHFSAVQIRRDMMHIGYSGSNRRGYETANILESISNIIDHPKGMNICVAGIGNLGKALVNYFYNKSQKLKIKALFDVDDKIVGKKINGIKCYHIKELGKIIEKNDIKIGLISTPNAHTKDIADEMMRAGVRSIINFTSTPLNLPESMFLEEVDITTSIEKSSYFAKTLINNSEGISKNRKILLVDKYPDISESCRLFLTNNNYELIKAGDSVSGMKKLLKGNIDLIILGIELKDPGSGLIFLNELKRQNINIPIVLTSSKPDIIENTVNLKGLNIRSISQKPINERDIYSDL